MFWLFSVSLFEGIWNFKRGITSGIHVQADYLLIWGHPVTSVKSSDAGVRGVLLRLVWLKMHGVLWFSVGSKSFYRCHLFVRLRTPLHKTFIFFFFFLPRPVGFGAEKN